MSIEACRTLARQRWGRQAGLYREGIRRGRSAARETDTGQERPRKCWACGQRTMGRVFGRVG